jgi:uncharacterized membrane protein
MTKYLWAYAGAAAVFIVADFIWLGFVARDFYRNQLGELMLDRPLWGVAIAFYLLYLIGVVVFGVSAGLRDGALTSAILYGALFGLFAYATYDLTNLATLKNWPATMTLVDIAWGTFVTAAASAGGYALAVRMSG